MSTKWWPRKGDWKQVTEGHLTRSSMGMHARLEAQAEKDLLKLPQMVKDHVVREIRRLAASSTSMSRPAVFPHPLRGQLFDTRITVGRIEHFITLMFTYSSDEQYIEINWIMHRERPEGEFPSEH